MKHLNILLVIILFVGCNSERDIALEFGLELVNCVIEERDFNNNYLIYWDDSRINIFRELIRQK